VIFSVGVSVSATMAQIETKAQFGSCQ